jgi:hypothetical protein
MFQAISTPHALPDWTGTVNRKMAPRGSLVFAHSRPPCASMIERQMERPSPKPSGLVVWNALNSCSIFVGAKAPAPEVADGNLGHETLAMLAERSLTLKAAVSEVGLASLSDAMTREAVAAGQLRYVLRNW